jgi:CheY-like chemotaxis protein
LSACATTEPAILLVEDLENDAILVRLAFERAGIGHRIYCVPGGLEAIAYLNSDPPYQDRNRYPMPSLLLVDVKMPRMDGFELLRWIRERPEFEKLPVVMLTGSNEPREEDTAYKLGATSFW